MTPANRINNSPNIVRRLIDIFNLRNLALILEAYDMIQARSGHGEIILVIYDGKCKGVEEKTKLR